MLDTLRLGGYRSFGRYRLPELTRVNLLVGRNNSGKTSLLEAVELLAARGDPQVLLRSAERRGEAAPARDPDGRTYWRTNIAHLFHGHDVAPGTGIRLEAGPRHHAITLRIRPLTAEEGNGEAALSLFEEHGESAPALALEIAGHAREGKAVLPVGPDGSVQFRRLPVTPAPSGTPSRPTRFLTPRSLEPGGMRTMWDTVQVEGRESEVIRAVRLVLPDLESIHFLSSDPTRSRLPAAGVLVGLGGGSGRRVPLGSQGDGIRRLLALSLALINSAGGFLLIDEIEAGLHWTVMRRMWRFVIEAAKESSVQVFATTHSLDCVRGLASLLEEQPELGSEVSAHKLDRRLENAVALDAGSIRNAVEQEIELR